MTESKLFSYLQAIPGVKGGVPFVPIALTYRDHTIHESALVDSGSTVNVLPYDVGLQLGFIWEEQDFPLDVLGVLRGAPAYGVLLTGEIEPFPPVRLAFVCT